MEYNSETEQVQQVEGNQEDKETVVRETITPAKRLGKVFNLKQSDNKITIAVSVDGGSTGTRVVMLEETTEGVDLNLALEGIEEDPFEIPSDLILLKEAHHLRPSSPNLYDTMLTLITPVGLGGLVETSFVARGSLIDGSSDPVQSIGSSTAKILNPVFYYNLVDSIGYSLIEQYGGEIPREVDIKIAVALPPQDNSKSNLEKFNKTLTSFIWNYAGRVEVKMNFTHRVTLTEPEAQDRAKAILYGDEDEINVAENTHVIEGGGRSLGNSATRGKQAIKDTQKTLEYGGKLMVDMLIQRYNEQFGQKISTRVAAEALETGFVRRGAKGNDNVIPMIMDIKDIVARKISTDVRVNCYDVQNVLLPTEITEVVFSGKMFRPGDYNYPLSKPLTKELSTWITNAGFSTLPFNLIPIGLMLFLIQELSIKVLGEEEEEQQASASFFSFGTPQVGETQVGNGIESSVFGSFTAEVAATSESANEQQSVTEQQVSTESVSDGHPEPSTNEGREV